MIVTRPEDDRSCWNELACARLASDVFAGNRAVGRIAFTVAADAGGTRRPACMRRARCACGFPTPQTATRSMPSSSTPPAAWPAATVSISTSRSAPARGDASPPPRPKKSTARSGPDTRSTSKLDGRRRRRRCAWLPQETILFDKVRLRRSIDVDARAGRAICCSPKPLVFGRSAMGETRAHGPSVDRWRVRVDGRLVFAENVRLDGEIAPRWRNAPSQAAASRSRACSKCPATTPVSRRSAPCRTNFAGEVGVSAWNGLALARLVAPDGAALRHDLVARLTALGDAPLPRLWMN